MLTLKFSTFWKLFLFHENTLKYALIFVQFWIFGSNDNEINYLWLWFQSCTSWKFEWKNKHPFFPLIWHSILTSIILCAKLTCKMWNVFHLPTLVLMILSLLLSKIFLSIFSKWILKLTHSFLIFLFIKRTNWLLK